jgi:hypothetical protein
MPRGTKPLRATTAFKAGTALARHVGLAQVGRRRAAEAEASGKPVRATLTTRHRATVPADKRAALEKRSGGVCEMQLPSLPGQPGCTWWATDVCHRRTQGMGGRFGEAKEQIDQLSDTMHGCRNCHQQTHDQPAEAKDDGLRLDEWQNPLAEPVLYRGELSYLTDDGRVIDFGDAGP